MARAIRDSTALSCCLVAALCLLSTGGLTSCGGDNSPTATSDPRTLAAPSAFSATATSSSTIQLTWTNESTTATGVRIYRGSSAATANTLIAAPTGEPTSYGDSGLNPSTPYFYRICAFKDSDVSGYAEASATTEAAGGPPSIVISKSSLGFSANVGSGNPASQAVTITNGGTGSLTGLTHSVSYSSGSGWLSVTRSSSTAPSTMTLSPATGSLAAGTYEATITVSSPVAANSPQAINVIFTVSAGTSPLIGLSTTSLSFTAQHGGTSPSAKSVAITNGSTGSLTGLSRTYPGGNPIFMSSSLGSTSAPTTLTVQPSLNGFSGPLAPGTYQTTIAVNSPVASNSPQTVSVTFTIESAPRQVRIINNSQAGLFLDDICQIKFIAPGGTFSTDDVLATDGLCWEYAQNFIHPGADLIVDVSVPDYWVFIGMGTWEEEFEFICSQRTPWWKRTYTTLPSNDNLWVWVTVEVSDHQSGTWDWTLTGNYTNGNLRLTPAGRSPIYFNRSYSNPIPGFEPVLGDSTPSEHEGFLPPIESSTSSHEVQGIRGDASGR